MEANRKIGTKEAAEICCLSPNTLREYRRRRRKGERLRIGPPFYEIKGRHPYYLLHEVEEWARGRRVE